MGVGESKGVLLGAIVLGLIGSACAEPQDSTEAVSVDFLNNVPYLQGQILQTHGGTDPWGTIFGQCCTAAAYFSYVRTDNKIGIIKETNFGNGTGLMQRPML